MSKNATIEAPKRRGRKPIPGYDERAAQRDLMAKKRAEARDIEIPKCANPRRRARCKNDLLLFAKTYFSKSPSSKYPNKKGWFGLKPSEMHVQVFKDLQNCILYGDMQAWAGPRGFGKDTIMKIAAIWATFYGHSRFFVVAAYNEKHSSKRIGDIKNQIEINDLLCEDFPEICIPVRKLEGATQRGKSQTVNGEPTRIVWGAEYVSLPCVEGSEASGAIICPSSINGAIRGMLIDGQRPTFVAISDPQTRESAKSDTQREDIMEAIQQDFGGLASHDEPLGCFCLVTIIKKGDVADQLTDPEQHPEWNGRRDKAFIEWPERMDLWDEYEELRKAGQKSKKDRLGREAHRFYLSNRAEMDKGAVIQWQDAYIRKKGQDGKPLEVSHIQHLMNLRIKWGHEAFQVEFQNEPIEEGNDSQGITAELVMHRLNDNPHQVLPEGCARLVIGMDLRQSELHYVAAGLMEDGTAPVVDYVIEPYGHEADPDLKNLDSPIDAIILTHMRRIRDSIGSGLYRTHDGEPVTVDLALVDSGWKPKIVYRFCKESGPKWRAIKGDGRKRGQKAYTRPNPGQGIAIGNDWYGKYDSVERVWLWHLNSDHWKEYVHDGFRQQPNTPGSITLFGSDPKVHKLYAKHVTAEKWDVEKRQWVELSKWNHFFDCTCYAMAAGDMLKIRRARREVLGEPTPQAQVARRQTGQMGWVRRGAGKGEWWKR